MNHYAILERPHDDKSLARALFFRQAFGGMIVPLVDGERRVMLPPGAKEDAQYYKADVFRDAESKERFCLVCMARAGGMKVLEVSNEYGFYPVNVDGVTLMSVEKPLIQNEEAD